MNYLKIYNSIITNSKNKEIERIYKRKNKIEYYENHHIIPESSGGDNSIENMVLLTAKEHFLCHWLLYKINPSNANAFAWWMMSNNDGNKFHEGRNKQTSIKYEIARKAFSEHITKINKGRKHTEIAKQNMTEAWKKRPPSQPLSEEHKRKLSEINSGENNPFFGKTHNSYSKEKMSLAGKQRIGEKSNVYGYHHTDELKEKFSKLYTGKPRSKPHEIVSCPHCNKTGIKPNMKRWHYDNCKELK
jgi:hypothetical protein